MFCQKAKRPLTLTLFVTWLLTDHAYVTVTLDDLTVAADFFNRRTYFHNKLHNRCRTTGHKPG